MEQPRIILETERLRLQTMTWEDFPDLCEILQDKTAMAAYEHAFSELESRAWLERQKRRYKTDGFGLWSMIRLDTGQWIGQAGLTMQELPGGPAPEIGYLLKRRFWRCGYAVEAAAACKRYAFESLGFDAVYSIIRDTNYASQRVARRNGMTLYGQIVKHYWGVDMPHLVFRAVRGEG